MRRRQFMRTAALGTAAVLSYPAAAGARRQGMEREVENLSVTELCLRLQRGETTATALTAAYLDRIERLDRQGPCLRAVIEVNPEAVELAAVLDRQQRAGQIRGPLHGIPVLIKDNIDTGDSMQTTAGSLAMSGSRAPRDAPLVARLRQAGAVVLGKTNMSEWANFRSFRSSSGWSSRGGQTRNPYVLDRSPCGSSSGAGVAVAADLCAAAVGTETDGSIVCPSTHNGIVGLKPTLGLISRTGIIPIAASQDTAGPMGRTVADVALLLGVLAGADDDDAATLAVPAGRPTDYVRCLDAGALNGARLGVARQYGGFHERAEALLDEALAAMRAAGAQIVDPAEVATRQQLDGPELEVLLYEFKAGVDQYLAGLGPGAPVQSLAEVISFNEAHRDQVMPYFGQELLLQAQAKGPLTEPAYLKARSDCLRLARAEGIDATLTAHSLDAIVALSGGPAWPIDLVLGDHGMGGSSTPAAVAGYPNITVPAGDVFGLPVGISFFAGAFAEPRLLALAYAFEQLTRKRRPPQFAPTLTLG